LNINIESQVLLSKQLRYIRIQILLISLNIKAEYDYRDLKDSFDIKAYQIEVSQFPTLSSLASTFNFQG